MDEENTQEFAAGFVPMIRTEGDVSLREAGSLLVAAGGNASIQEGGTGWLVVGGDVTMSQAGSGNMIVGGAVEMSDSAVGQLMTTGATVSHSRIAVLLAGRATLEESEVVIGTQQAIGLGVAAGVTMLLLGRLLRRS